MKTKRIFTIFVSLLLTVQVFALGDHKTIRERTGSWLKSSSKYGGGNTEIFT
jgi:hypothetical protein